LDSSDINYVKKRYFRKSLYEKMAEVEAKYTPLAGNLDRLPSQKP
jgi:hypothetical protein